MLDKRQFLKGTAVIGATGLAGGSLAGCANSPQVVTAVIDAVMKAVSQACGVVPIATSVIAVITTLFPAAAGVAIIGEALLKEISDAICTALKANPPASDKVGAVLVSGKVEIHGFYCAPCAVGAAEAGGGSKPVYF